MKARNEKLVEWFLRISISTGLLSAVADRFGLWPQTWSAWGNWDKFISYTHKLNPWFSDTFAGIIGVSATILEIFFAIVLLTTYKTPLFAKGAGILLLLFGMAMALNLNIKAPLDYSVFMGAAAAFALSILSQKKNDN